MYNELYKENNNKYPKIKENKYYFLNYGNIDLEWIFGIMRFILCSWIFPFSHSINLSSS